MSEGNDHLYNNIKKLEAMLFELSGSSYELLAAEAEEAATYAYCPYSLFTVGAAVMMEDGSIYTGCNVENASYGLTICAERNAIFHAVSRGHKQVVAIAIYTPTDEPVPPCGACRQVINEFGPDATIICMAKDRKMLTISLTEILPHAFGPKNLEDD